MTEETKARKADTGRTDDEHVCDDRCLGEVDDRQGIMTDEELQTQIERGAGELSPQLNQLH